MSNIQISLENIIKTNNGKFKSQKQADFLLSVLKDNNVFSVNVNGYALVITYLFDDKGVTLKTITSLHTHKTTEEWSRKVEGILSVDDKAVIKQINKRIKALDKSIKSRQASFDNGAYPDAAMFNELQGEEVARLENNKKQLQVYVI